MLSQPLPLAIVLENPTMLFICGLSLLILFIWYFATDHERRKRNVGAILTLGVCLLSTFAFLPIDQKLKGGIDLVGGSSFTLIVGPKSDPDDPGKTYPATSEHVEEAIKVIKSRLNAYGTIDMSVNRQGTDRIVIQMPGMSAEDSNNIETLLKKVAKLDFRRVNMEGFLGATAEDPRNLAQKVFEGDEVRPGYKAFKHVQSTDDGPEITEYLLLTSKPAIEGRDVIDATPSANEVGQPQVAIKLGSEGGDKMIRLTQDMRPDYDRIAVVLDNTVLTAPSVKSVPLGSSFVITGQKNAAEARNLANALKNPLENPLVIDKKTSISPTLGKAFIQQGVYSGLTGLAITAIFVLLYYRLAGIVALIGLAVNAIILFGLMAIFQFTFTLPGIAGMILTIGMAVDANVLIYERLREEMAAGKSLKVAISTAYDRAFSAIFDSNITSLITSVILFWRGSDSIQGFAITLTIGIIASMFSAILVTRVLFRFGSDFGVLKSLSFLNLIKSTKFDFLSKGKASLIISAVASVICIGAFFIRGENAYGIDFTGGTVVQFQMPPNEHLNQPEVEAKISEVSLSKRPVVQEENSITGQIITIRCATPDTEPIVKHLRESFDVLGKSEPVLDSEGKDTGKSRFVVQESVEDISATAGREFLVESAIALVLGILGILLYITFRFEFSFALGGFVAILHDVIVSAGIVVLLGSELSLIHLGAILTVAGYSVNDTIVIFDRIRESLQTGTGEVRDLMNEAINATLSRTILTSLTTIITVALLTIFGGSALKDFSAMILVGLIVGTYSSVFIASPIVLWYSSRKGGSLRKEIMQTSLQEADIAR